MPLYQTDRPDFSRYDPNYIPYYSAEEQMDMWDKLGAFGGDALAYVGGTLDKIGRPTRQLLAEGRSWFGGPEHDFDWSEAFSWVPFSDTMGLTDPRNQATGKDVLGWDDPDSSWDDVASFAVEVVADPLNFLTLGAHKAVTVPAKAMRNAGILDDAIVATAKFKNVDLATDPLLKGKIMMETTADDALSFLKQDIALQNTADDAADIIKNLDDRMSNAIKGVAGDNVSPDFLNQKMSTLFGVHRPQPVPFLNKLTGSGKPSMWGDYVWNVGSGPAAVKTAELMGRAGDAIKRAPGVEVARRNIFSPLAKARTRAGIRGAEQTFWKSREAAEATAVQLKDINRRLIEGVPGEKPYMEIGDTISNTGHVHNDIVSDYMEEMHLKNIDPNTGDVYASFEDWVTQKYSKGALRGFESSGTRQALDELKEIMEEIPEIAEAAGVAVNQLDDPHVAHFFRQINPRFKDGGLIDEEFLVDRMIDVDHVGTVGRKEALKNIPGGTSALNRASRNPKLIGWKGRENLVGYPQDVLDEIRNTPELVAEKFPVQVDRGGQTVTEWRDIGNNPEGLAYREDQIEELADWLGDINPRYGSDQFNVSIFKTNPAEQAEKYLTSIRQAVVSADAAYETIASMARTADDWADAAGSPTYRGELQSVEKTLEQLKFVEDDALGGTRVAKGSLQSMKREFDRIKAHKSGGLPANFKGVVTDDDYDFLLRTLKDDAGKDLFIPKELADELAEAYSVILNPKTLAQKRGWSVVEEFYNRMVNSFKIGVTTRYPAFHIRNSIGGQVNNMLVNAFSPESRAAAMTIRLGKILNNAASDYRFESKFIPQGLQDFVVDGRVTIPKGAMDPLGVMENGGSKKVAEDALATQLLLFQAEAKGVISRDMFFDRIDTAAVKSNSDNIYISNDPMNVGSAAEGWVKLFTQNLFDAGKRVMADDKYGTWSGTFWDMVTGGVAGAVRAEGSFGGPMNKGKFLSKADQDYSKIIAMGKQTGDLVEYDNRMSPFLKLLQDGVSVDQAAATVGRAQVDYSLLSDVERKYFRKVMGFYSFTKGMTPFMLDQLATRPGGPLAQQIKATYRLRRDDPDFEAAPEWIRRGTGFKIPGLGEGNYIPSMGMPWEDFISLVPENMDDPFLGPGDSWHQFGWDKFVKHPLQYIMDKSVPYFRQPIEYMTGTDFFYNRPQHSVPEGTPQGWSALIPGASRTGIGDRAMQMLGIVGKDAEGERYDYRPSAMFSAPVSDKDGWDAFVEQLMFFNQKDYSKREGGWEQQKLYGLRDRVEDYLETHPAYKTTAPYPYLDKSMAGEADPLMVLMHKAIRRDLRN